MYLIRLYSAVAQESAMFRSEHFLDPYTLCQSRLMSPPRRFAAVNQARVLPAPDSNVLDSGTVHWYGRYL
jgi:hypothetical protein